MRARPAAARGARLRPRRHRHRVRQQRLLQPAQDARAASLEHRLQAAELESRELDVPERPYGAEAEIGEEVAGKDRAVDEESLVGRLSLRVTVSERLECAGALVARLPDRCEK